MKNRKSRRVYIEDEIVPLTKYRAPTATDVLTEAVAAWMTETATKLDGEKLKALQTCLNTPRADVRVMVVLREGLLILEVTDGKRIEELYREKVLALRPRRF